MYNKLFTKILDSSVWLESTPTRIVWLTFLAAMDETGFAQFAAVRNVSHRARVTLEEAEEAVRTLEAPDADSSNPNNEGRRIERVPGGWMVLNADEHRKLVTKVVIQEQTRIRVARHREKKRNAQETIGNARPLNVTPSEAVAEAVAEARSEATISNSNNKLVSSGSVSTTSGNGNGHTNARSRHPIFKGERIVVFDWMLEDMRRILGPELLDAFDIHAWFLDLDKQVTLSGNVIPKSEQWNYIQGALVAEAALRGLPIVTATDPNRKPTQTEKIAATLAKIDALAQPQKAIR